MTAEGAQKGKGAADDRVSGNSGQHVVPFQQFLLKIHSLCNLSCDYCYVYFAADQSWRRRPSVMNLHTVRQAVDRIAEHVYEHRLPQVRIILHGGEPLLVGERHLDDLLTVIGERLAPATDVRTSMQTNGVLLDRRLLEVLVRHRVRVGVSLDGAASAHDRHRRYAHGGPSHHLVARALRLLTQPRYEESYAGLLCTIDLENDPVETYEALLEFSPPEVDFLLPHGTWDRPPPRLGHRTTPPAHPPGVTPADDLTPYAQWLCAVFDRWFHAPRKETAVRIFDELVSGLLGGPVNSEVFGLAPADLVVVEADATIERPDSLKVVREGAPETGFDVFRHSFSEVLEAGAFRECQDGPSGLPPVCGRCSLAAVCGGGLYAHRYRTDTGFANATVYCRDLAALITHIRRRLDDSVRGLVASDASGTKAKMPSTPPDRP